MGKWQISKKQNYKALDISFYILYVMFTYYMYMFVFDILDIYMFNHIKIIYKMIMHI
jgi:hypothetical protein